MISKSADGHDVPRLVVESQDGTSSHPAKKQSASKRIRFQPTVKVQPIDCTMTVDEYSRSFYTKAELNLFSHEARLAKAIYNEVPHLTCCVHASKDRGCMAGQEAVIAGLRGLELHLCPIRNQNRVLVQKAIAKYQRSVNADQDMNSEEKVKSLASACAKLSQWSKLVALNFGSYDSLQARANDYMIPVSDPVDFGQSRPVAAKRRPRRVTESDDDSQPGDKRRRTSSSLEPQPCKRRDRC